MRNTVHWLKQFSQDETGAAMIEYGLLVALISVALISTLNAMTVQLEATFKTVATELQNAVP